METFPQSLDIFILEDKPQDAHLIQREVLKIAPQAQVDVFYSFPLLQQALAGHRPDLILSDYRLSPTFNGLDALMFVKTLEQPIPFVFITGSLNDEELAAQTILSGASGFILKKEISTLHQKLRPYFQQILEKQSQQQKSRAQIKQMVSYLDQVHRENNQIWSDLKTTKQSIEDSREQLKIIQEFLKDLL